MNAPTPLTTRTLAFIGLTSVACVGVSDHEVAQLRTLSANINKDRDGDCVQGLKDAKPFVKYTEPSAFQRPREDASALILAATSRCATQAKQDFRHGRYSAGVQKLEAWKRILPSTFPTNTRYGLANTTLTARGLFERHKPKAKAQEKIFNVSFQIYSSTDASKYPALAYHQLYPLLKQVPPSIERAASIDRQRDELLKILKRRKALAHSIVFKGKDVRFDDIMAAHESNVRRSPNHYIDTQSPYVILTTSIGKMISRTGTKKETFKHKYVASQRTIKNLDHDQNQHKLKVLQRRYVKAQRAYKRIQCAGGGIKGKDCGRVETQRLQNLSRDIRNTRRHMGKPTKVQINHAYFQYPVTRPYKTFSYPVVIEARWPGQPKRKPVVWNYTAMGYSQGTEHASHAKYGIRAQRVTTAPDVKIQSNAHTNAASAFFDVLNKISADRAAQPLSTNLSTQAAANAWLLRYCVRAPNVPAEQFSQAFQALKTDAQKLIGSPACSDQHYNQSFHSPKSARRAFKMLQALDEHRKQKTRRR